MLVYNAMTRATQGTVFFNLNFDEVIFTMESYKAMTRATQGTMFSNTNSDKTTTTLLNYKAMMWATQGTVFSVPNSNTITSSLLSNKAMVWATTGRVFSTSSLGTAITVSTEDKLATHLLRHKVQQYFQLLPSKAKIITTYNVMFYAKVKDKYTASTTGVVVAIESKVHGLHQQLSDVVISQASNHFHLKQNSTLVYPEDGTSAMNIGGQSFLLSGNSLFIGKFSVRKLGLF
jgi:hypothetical protein